VIGFLIGFLGHLAVSAIIAGRMYRREYDLVYGSPAPQIYGGKHGHDAAHRAAMREAMPWFAFWPFFGLWAGMGWLITLGHRQSWVERANELRKLEEETGQLATQQDPLAGLDRTVGGGMTVTHDQDAARHPCPCGYVTECPVHCGDGHLTGRCPEHHFPDYPAPRPTARLADHPEFGDLSGVEILRYQRQYGVPVAVGPEILRVRNPEIIAQHVTCGNIREYEVGTVARPGVKLFIDDRGHCWEDR
jgi:hypothetical protein